MSRSVGPTGGPSIEAASEITIGMYHPKVGSRRSGGICTYVRELLDALPANVQTYLYTESGPYTGSLGEITDVVEVSTKLRYEAGQQRVPIDFTLPVEDALESVAFFGSAAFDGAIEHINSELDVLFVHGQIDSVLVSNVVDVPVVRVYHGVERTGRASQALGALSSATGAIANSQHTARALEEELGFGVEGIVWPGVDIETFSPETPPAFDREECVVLFVGRLTERKGPHDLVRAFADSEADAHLVIVGRGNEDLVREPIEEHALGDSVSVEGIVPDEQLPGYYAAADVFCLPAYYESFGIVNLEAMACGTPVLTTDIPAITAFATHRESAYLVEPGDRAGLRRGLDELIGSPSLRDRLGSAGRSVAESYSWEQSADALLSTSQQFLD